MAKKPSQSSFPILNLEKEKQKFLFDQKYNPQFEYDDNFDDQLLTRHNYSISNELLETASDILQKVLKIYGDEDTFLEQEGPLMSVSDVDKQISEYLKQENLQKRVKIITSNKFVARTSVQNLEDETFELRLRLPYDYRALAFQAMLAHEVGTHMLRWVNEFSQPWHKRHREYGMQEYMPTEEGLAVLNASLHHPAPFFWLPAIYYFSGYHAQTKSFSELNSLLKTYVPNVERRWKICLRVKRGLRDTSEPGGYKKDLVYLTGIFELSKWLRAHNFSAQELYIGKVHHNDIEKMKSFSALTSYSSPSFLKDPLYGKKLDKILKANGI